MQNKADRLKVKAGLGDNVVLIGYSNDAIVYSGFFDSPSKCKKYLRENYYNSNIEIVFEDIILPEQKDIEKIIKGQ